jgi:hypothetical protein
MTHLPDRASAAAILGALALAIAAPSPAAAQPQVPAAPSWYALPGVVPAGTTVVVRTRDAPGPPTIPSSSEASVRNWFRPLMNPVSRS